MPARFGPHYHGSCHCGAVRFSVTGEIAEAYTCDCSLCSRRGAVMSNVHESKLKILAGEDKLTLYQFNTRTAKHWFCRTCGIYTHHQRRSDPSVYGINVACLKGVSPFDFSVVPVVDGIAHPSDTGLPSRTIGTLRFDPA